MLQLKNIFLRLHSTKAHLFVLFFIETTMRILHIYHFQEQGCGATTSNLLYRQSSIICHFDIFLNKLCFFSHIYLIKGEKLDDSFIFTINKNSTISGLRDRDDLKTINLSSIKNHTKMFMNVIVVSLSQSLRNILTQFLLTGREHNYEGAHMYISNNIDSKNENKFLASNTLVFHEPIFIIRRFKCDNVMHVLHDDLLPLFVTYNRLCVGDIDLCISHYRLMFIDECDSSQFLQLYEVFSADTPLFLHKMKRSNPKSNLLSEKIYLFKKVRAGMDTSSVWFDYGFVHQQGGVTESKIDAIILEKFCDFIIKKLKIKKHFDPSNKLNILILNRKVNRKIINVSELKEKIKQISTQVFQKDVSISESDLYENNIQDFIEQILKAEVIIGMHSSSLILTIFRLLMNKTIIFELFPFGVQPKFVSFLYPLRKIVGAKIIYKFWTNGKENKLLMYPNNPKMYGGLGHLSAVERKRILDTKIIPAVRCCHDPAYLFRMYQDTHVDETFLKLYRSNIENFATESEANIELNNWFFPAAVSLVKCSFEGSLVLISWTVPKNTFVHAVQYKVVIAEEKSKPFAFIVNENQLVFNLSYHNIHLKPLKLSVWIKSFVPELTDVESVDVFYSCLQQDEYRRAPGTL